MLRVLLFFALLASGCARPTVQSPRASTPPVGNGAFYAVRPDAQPAGSTAVVFPFHPDDTLAFAGFPLVRPLTAVTLSPAELQRVDSLVQAVERDQGLRARDYRHQYVPVVDGRGARLVWVNGFCRADSAWTRRVVSYKGGGVCFYRAQLELATRRYTGFGTNAPK